MRQKEPVGLIVAKGRSHLTKAEIKAREAEEVHAPDDKIEAPSWLSKKESRKFDEIAAQLKAIGIITNLDCDVLGRYVRADTEYEKVTKILRSVSPNDIDAYTELVDLQGKIHRQALDCAKELGLTISSRCKLVMPKTDDDKPQNKFLVG